MSDTCCHNLKLGVLRAFCAPPLGDESGSSCRGGSPWSLLYTCPSAAWLCFLALQLQVQLQAESRVLVSHRGQGGPGILTRHTSRGERTLNGQSGPSTGQSQDGHPGAGQGPGVPHWASCQPWCSRTLGEAGGSQCCQEALGTAAVTTGVASLVLIAEPETGPGIYSSGLRRNKAVRPKEFRQRLKKLGQRSQKK